MPRMQRKAPMFKLLYSTLRAKTTGMLLLLCVWGGAKKRNAGPYRTAAWAAALYVTVLIISVHHQYTVHLQLMLYICTIVATKAPGRSWAQRTHFLS